MAPLMARPHHFLLSHPLYGGVGVGWVDISGHSWPGEGYTAPVYQNGAELSAAFAMFGHEALHYS